MIKDYDDYSSLGITISLFPTECYLSSLIKQEIQHHLYMQIWNLTEMIKKKKKNELSQLSVLTPWART